jgi:hypothetical protein
MTLEGKMERLAVNSSNLASVGYDEERSTLEVEFRSGLVYHFYNVPAYRFSGLMRASSVGGYFDSYIRKRSYRYRQVWGVG